MEPAIDIPTASNILTSNFESPPCYFIQTNLNLKHENRHLDKSRELLDIEAWTPIEIACVFLSWCEHTNLVDF